MTRIVILKQPWDVAPSQANAAWRRTSGVAGEDGLPRLETGDSLCLRQRRCCDADYSVEHHAYLEEDPDGLVSDRPDRRKVSKTSGGAPTPPDTPNIGQIALVSKLSDFRPYFFGGT